MAILPLKVCHKYSLFTPALNFLSLQVTKPLCLFEILVDALGIYFNPKAEPYTKLFFENANSGYAEVSAHIIQTSMSFLQHCHQIRQHVCNGLYVLLSNQWQPWRPSTESFLAACNAEQDPLQIR